MCSCHSQIYDLFCLTWCNLPAGKSSLETHGSDTCRQIHILVYMFAQNVCHTERWYSMREKKQINTAALLSPYRCFKTSFHPDINITPSIIHSTIMHRVGLWSLDTASLCVRLLVGGPSSKTTKISSLQFCTTMQLQKESENHVFKIIDSKTQR